jgi:hypothetical protein
MWPKEKTYLAQAVRSIRTWRMDTRALEPPPWGEHFNLSIVAKSPIGPLRSLSASGFAGFSEFPLNELSASR